VSGGIARLFLNLGTRRGVLSASRPGRLYPRERPGTHCTGGWVGPGAGLDRCGKSRPTGITYIMKGKPRGQDVTSQIQGNQVNSITILRFPLQHSTFLPYSVLYPLLYSCLIFLFITLPTNIRFSHYALFIIVCLFSCLLHYSLKFYLLFKFLFSSLRVLSILSFLLLLFFTSCSLLLIVILPLSVLLPVFSTFPRLFSFICLIFLFHYKLLSFSLGFVSFPSV
jgi:hypothetical protein